MNRIGMNLRRGEEGNGIGFSLFKRPFSYSNRTFDSGHLPGKAPSISQWLCVSWCLHFPTLDFFNLFSQNPSPFSYQTNKLKEIRLYLPLMFWLGNFYFKDLKKLRLRLVSENGNKSFKKI